MLARKIIEKASSKVDSAIVNVSSTEAANASYENNKLKSATSYQNLSANIRVIVNGRLGSSHTTDSDDVDGLISRAIEAAQFGSPADFAYPGQMDGTPVEIFDARVCDITKKDLVDIGGKMLEVLGRYGDEMLKDASVYSQVSSNEIATTAGAVQKHDSTYFGGYAHGQIIRGTDILSVYESRSTLSRDVDFDAMANKVLDLCKAAEKTVRAPSGGVPVIFAPRASHILLAPLVMGINGKNVLLGTSPLRDKLGESIASQQLSVTDNPHIDYALGSGTHDGDCIPCRTTPILEGGELKSFLYDLETASRAGKESTGNGPGCGPHNVVVEAGQTSFDQMVSGLKEGIVVYNVLGYGQGNIMAGEFSVNLQLAYKVENGEIIGRVKDAMLSGNIYDAIHKIEAIGDSCQWSGGAAGTVLAPHIMVKGLNVVG